MAKVLQMCTRYPPGPGGVETHVHEMAHYLTELGDEISVTTSDMYIEVPFVKLPRGVFQMDGITVRRRMAVKAPGRIHYVFMPWMLYDALALPYDIIHAHSYGYFQTNIAAFSRLINRRAFVFTTHFHPRTSMWGGEERKALRGIYDRVFSKFVLDRADAIIGMAKREMELLCEHNSVDESKIHIIPSGIDFARYKEIPDPTKFRKAFGIPLDKKMVLYCGRLASNKGLFDLVAASKDVLAAQDAVFVFVGEDQGLKEGLLKKASELGVSDKIMFTGHVKDQSLFESAYSACDVFVLPSEYEALGMVLFEAMACAKPCVGTRVGGVPEVIEDGKTGTVVEYNDPKALAEAILSFTMDEKKSAEFGNNGRIRVRDKFSWDNTARGVHELYKTLL